MIETHQLSKKYGRVHALRGLDLHIEPGEIYGLLGPNGAGKTTTLRLLLDLIRPSGGTISIFGLDLATHSVAIRRRLGYLPGDLVLYPNLTGHQLLALCAGLRGHRDLSVAHARAERMELELDRRRGGPVLVAAHRPRGARTRTRAPGEELRRGARRLVDAHA